MSASQAGFFAIARVRTLETKLLCPGNLYSVGLFAAIGSPSAKLRSVSGLCLSLIWYASSKHCKGARSYLRSSISIQYPLREVTFGGILAAPWLDSRLDGPWPYCESFAAISCQDQHTSPISRRHQPGALFVWMGRSPETEKSVSIDDGLGGDAPETIVVA